jgi:hypothetical protein
VKVKVAVCINKSGEARGRADLASDFLDDSYGCVIKTGREPDFEFNGRIIGPTSLLTCDDCCDTQL